MSLAGLKKFYQNKNVAGGYAARRFASPRGARINEKELNAFKELIGDDAYKTVLELACGRGRLTQFLARHYAFRVCAVDSSPAMLKENLSACKERNVSCMVADAFKLPFNKQGFDACVMLRFCHHLRAAQLSELLGSLKDYLLPGGAVIFNTSNALSMGVLAAWTNLLPGRYATHVFLTDRAVRRIARAQGYEVVKKKNIFFIPVFVYRLAGKGILLGILESLNAFFERACPCFASMTMWKIARAPGHRGSTQGETR